MIVDRAFAVGLGVAAAGAGGAGVPGLRPWAMGDAMAPAGFGARRGVGCVGVLLLGRGAQTAPSNYDVYITHGKQHSDLPARLETVRL